MRVRIIFVVTFKKFKPLMQSCFTLAILLRLGRLHHQMLSAVVSSLFRVSSSGQPSDPFGECYWGQEARS